MGWAPGDGTPRHKVGCYLLNGSRDIEGTIRSDPHPFISLLTPIKRKKLLPRATRHFSTQQSLTLLTLLVACFSQLDVVVDAGILDGLEETQERKDVDAQTQAFLGSVMQSLLPMAANAGLRLVSGILGVFLERNDVVEVSKTKVCQLFSR